MRTTSRPGTARSTRAVAGVSFPQLATWLALPYQPQQGWGALKVKFEVARGALAGVAAGLDLRAIETTLGEGLPALRLDAGARPGGVAARS